MSNKYEYTQNMREISGLGGEYEDACRKMVIAGIEWTNSKGNANPQYVEYQNIYGITIPKNEDAKELQKVMAQAVDNDCTGAMMQACMNHVLFVLKNGWDKYIEKMTKKELANE